MRGFPSRRDSIISAAIDIIGEAGVQGLSTKEIANKQEISESVLYKHFKSIDEVVIAVVDYFFQYDDMIEKTISQKDIAYKAKILEYINSFVELYENYPALASIILNYEPLMNQEQMGDTVFNAIHKRANFIKEMVKSGQKSGEIELNYTVQEFTDIIMGICTTIILRWKMSGYDFPLKKEVLTTIEKVLG